MKIFIFLFIFSFNTAHAVETVYYRVDTKTEIGFELKYEKIDALWVTITAYSPSVDECDDTPFITASNEKVRTGIIALSRDLEKDLNLKFGDMVYINGLGMFEFQDRMHRRKKRQVDIFFWTKKEAIEFGVKKNILYRNFPD